MVEIRHRHTGDILHVVSGNTLEGTDLNGARLVGADLRGANLRHADLSYASLQDADLREADLAHARLVNTSLWNADLRGANLIGARLSYEGRFHQRHPAWSHFLGLQRYSPSADQLRRANLQGARHDDTTIWPIGFAAEARGCIFVPQAPSEVVPAALPTGRGSELSPQPPEHDSPPP